MRWRALPNRGRRRNTRRHRLTATGLIWTWLHVGLAYECLYWGYSRQPCLVHAISFFPSTCRDAREPVRIPLIMRAHVDDRELVLAMGGELPPRRRSRVAAHLE